MAERTMTPMNSKVTGFRISAETMSSVLYDFLTQPELREAVREEHRMLAGMLDQYRTLLENLFFNPRRYDLGRVGRYKMNRRMAHEQPIDRRTLTKEDIVEMLKMMKYEMSYKFKEE